MCMQVGKRQDKEGNGMCHFWCQERSKSYPNSCACLHASNSPFRTKKVHGIRMKTPICKDVRGILLCVADFLPTFIFRPFSELLGFQVCRSQTPWQCKHLSGPTARPSLSCYRVSPHLFSGIARYRCYNPPNLICRSRRGEGGRGYRSTSRLLEGIVLYGGIAEIVSRIAA